MQNQAEAAEPPAGSLPPGLQFGADSNFVMREYVEPLRAPFGPLRLFARQGHETVHSSLHAVVIQNDLTFLPLVYLSHCQDECSMGKPLMRFSEASP